MNIVNLKINELKPYDNNPRMNDAAVGPVSESIKEFGFKVPIVVDSNYVIVAGHTRYKAAKKLGLKEVPCIIADDLTDNQIKSFRLADNKVGEIAEWDLDLLEFEMDGIDLDMSVFGFSVEDKEPELKEDNYNELKPTTPKAKYGDLYKLGSHYLMCGDSTKSVDIEKLLGGVEADLCITDPPYSVNYTQNKDDEKVQILNDNMEDGQFFLFLFDAFTQMLNALKPGAAYYIWHADSEGLKFRNALKEAGGQVKQNLIWVKNILVLGRQDYQWQHEPCLYGWKEGAGHYFTSERHHTTVIEDGVDIEKLKKEELVEIVKKFKATTETTILKFDKPKKNDVHPTMKPVKLIGHLMQNSSKKGDRVIDLFGGSGSTLIAAEQLGRKAYLMELDPCYVDVIIDRWEAMTGKKVVKIDDEEL